MYWYIEHHIGNKIKWCYLGKYEKLPEEYKRLVTDTQTDTQNIHKSEKTELAFKSEMMKPRWLSSVERQPRKLLVAGSKPARGSISNQTTHLDP